MITNGYNVIWDSITTQDEIRYMLISTLDFDVKVHKNFEGACI